MGPNQANQEQNVAMDVSEDEVMQTVILWKPGYVSSFYVT